MHSRNHKPIFGSWLGLIFLCSLALFLLAKLPDSSSKVYTPIELANFVKSRPVDAISPLVKCPQPQGESKALDLLNQAVSIARRLRDYRALSFAWGNLGHIYECRLDYQLALYLTQKAQLAAELDVSAKDSLYLWQWQAGRIFKAKNQIFKAIKYYELASENLENQRGNFVNINLQLDWMENLEIIYRQLIDIKLSLLKPGIGQSNSNNHNISLSSTLANIDALHLAEMRNNFVNTASLTKMHQNHLDLVSLGTDTAVINSIILADHTAIIVRFPNGQKKFTWINIDSKNLQQAINGFRQGLENYGDIIYSPKQAQKLYDWIILPFVKDLELLQIKTLVFIQDGILRSVPMAALHDGEKFLVEKYAITMTPNLNMSSPQTVHPKNLRVLAVGLTKEAIVDSRRYPALTNVATEIDQVQRQIPNSKQLLDENFTHDRLQNELSQTVYSVIHIATHGEFGNIAEDSFLVTGDNDKLTMSQLYSMISSIPQGAPTIDLLTLTACETAIGDDLGLAGVAVQAGVRSALASLWSINDASTVKLVSKFYELWRLPGVSKAQALAVAQQTLISSGGVYTHPAYWAGFILVGNWI